MHFITVLKLIENGVIKMSVFWDVAPCSLVDIDQSFTGAYCCIIIIIRVMSKPQVGGGGGGGAG
jgi:hypothetical protein